jgi:hypothetical protein
MRGVAATLPGMVALAGELLQLAAQPQSNGEGYMVAFARIAAVRFLLSHSPSLGVAFFDQLRSIYEIRRNAVLDLLRRTNDGPILYSYATTLDNLLTQFNLRVDTVLKDAILHSISRATSVIAQDVRRDELRKKFK